ncbi:MAG: ATP-dependent zinc metalloprotease FtsH [Gammaproteobacteria bacterium]|nr:ATP-dependent zinc metalloprotease FtsH [Gammaproteobacteria bacterium]
MNQRTPQPPPSVNFIRYWVVIALTLLILLLFLQVTPDGRVTRFEIPYSLFKELVKQQRVEEVVLKGQMAEGKLRESQTIGPKNELGQHFKTRIPEIGDDTLLPMLEEHNVRVNATPGAEEGVFLRLLLGFLPWLIFIGFFIWLTRRAMRNIGGRIGGPGDLKDFLEAPAKKVEVPKITFADVAGQENAKREVAELVEYLKNPDKFRKLGAEIPKGILLMGPPGTGKTLLARALAGEAGVPFFSISGSEFIEVFVGVGASRVRHLFEAAKKSAPSIVFIDELDSVGRTRGTGLGGGHDEREQTLNQILAEMDGFTGREAVLVLSATNRPVVLAPALLRPGRFDRNVTLDLPDRNDRIAILKVHMKNKPIAPDVDMDKLAAGTPGFSGADLKNLVNEAAILAARKNEQTITTQDFEDARDKVVMGTERTLAIEPDEKHRLAVHEAGHTVVAYFLPYADALHKVSIVPHGRALGATEQLPEHERHTLPEEYLQDRLAVILAARTAEKELLGTFSSGADEDIHQATLIARAMVSRWGMSEKIGPVDLRESEEHPFLGREIAQPRRYSEHSAEAVDDATRTLLLKAEQRAREVIKSHRPQLDRLIAALEEKETLHKEEIEKILGPKNLRKVENKE